MPDERAMPPQRAKILMVDDEVDLLKFARHNLARAGHTVQTASSAEEADKALEQETFDVVLLDLRMPGMGGMAFLHALQLRRRAEQVVVVTGYAEVDSAVEAMKAGACGYLAKPFDTPRVLAEITRILDLRAQRAPHQTLRAPGCRGVESLVGEHPSMRHLRQRVVELAPTSLSVLIRGETGTGKELVAEALHAASPRADKPLVRCNCAAFPEGTLESELFGHVKGAYTSAISDRRGRFEEADGGTLFLDEIGDLTPEAQIRLLRVLPQQAFEPVGSTETRRVDVRILTATHQDLEAARADGRFREDLYHRINSVTIQIPPLRAHLSDLPLLCAHIIRRDGAGLGTPVDGVSPAALEVLSRYGWPGNVRELENVLHSAMAAARGKTLGVDDLQAALPPPSRAPQSEQQGLWSCAFASYLLRESRRQMEHALMRRVLEETGGNISQAAARMGLARRNLQRKIQEYHIDVDQYIAKRKGRRGGRPSDPGP
ncbi:MAG: sigma-54 dependent transcriptional regulator [Candidatus Latescibacterota bacterium]